MSITRSSNVDADGIDDDDDDNDDDLVPLSEIILAEEEEEEEAFLVFPLPRLGNFVTFADVAAVSFPGIDGGGGPKGEEDDDVVVDVDDTFLMVK